MSTEKFVLDIVKPLRDEVSAFVAHVRENIRNRVSFPTAIVFLFLPNLNPTSQREREKLEDRGEFNVTSIENRGDTTTAALRNRSPDGRALRVTFQGARRTLGRVKIVFPAELVVSARVNDRGVDFDFSQSPIPVKLLGAPGAVLGKSHRLQRIEFAFDESGTKLDVAEYTFLDATGLTNIIQTPFIDDWSELVFPGLRIDEFANTRIRLRAVLAALSDDECGCECPEPGNQPGFGEYWVCGYGGDVCQVYHTTDLPENHGCRGNFATREAAERVCEEGGRRMLAAIQSKSDEGLPQQPDGCGDGK